MDLLPWVRALHLAATVMIGGACAFEFVILRRTGALAHAAGIAPVSGRWIRQQLAWGAGVGLVSWIGWLLAVAISMSGLSPTEALAPAVLGTVLEQTAFGVVWSNRLALLLAVMVLLAAGRSRARPVTVALFTASVALVASLAWTGHALGSGALHAWIDAVHLLAATAWLGMLPLLWRLARRAQGDSRWQALAVAGAHRFFLPGGVAVAMLAVSGLANTAWMLGSLENLTGTRYGQVLLLKLALFAAMVLLAALNRTVVVPRAQRLADVSQGLRWLHASVLAEVMLGLAILGVVAWLGVTPPAAHSPMAHSMVDM